MSQKEDEEEKKLRKHALEFRFQKPPERRRR